VRAKSGADSGSNSRDEGGGDKTTFLGVADEFA
jgi:hypothetical protein